MVRSTPRIQSQLWWGAVFSPRSRFSPQLAADRLGRMPWRQRAHPVGHTSHRLHPVVVVDGRSAAGVRYQLVIAEDNLNELTVSLCVPFFHAIPR